MNHFRSLYSLAAICILAGYASCSDDEESETLVAEPGKLVMRIDGLKTEYTVVSGLFQNGMIAISGGATGENIQLDVIEGLETGNFVVSGGDLAGNSVHFFRAGEAWGSPLMATETVGEISVTEVDEINLTVSGNFHCKIKKDGSQETADITAGAFTEIPYATFNTLGAEVFTGKVNGEAFGNLRSTATLRRDDFSFEFFNDDASIMIVMPSETGVGEFDFGDVGTTYFAMYVFPGENKLFGSSSGTLTISSHNPTTRHITGSFSFDGTEWPTGSGTVSVTEASFDIEY